MNERITYNTIPELLLIIPEPKSLIMLERTKSNKKIVTKWANYFKSLNVFK